MGSIEAARKQERQVNQAKRKMLERVRAILAKTEANGCTEEEAMTALAKAQELMAAYDIAESELGALDAQPENATVHRDERDDPFGIRADLATAVARFCKCRGFRDSGVFKFGMAGLESDVIFARWLLDTLQQFVLRGIKNHQAERRAQGFSNPRIVSASFKHGCVNRIKERLKELSPPEPVTIGGNSLVVSRKALINQALADAGIRLKTTSGRRINIHEGALNAGRNAGNSARFDRPVSAGGSLMIGAR